MLPDSKTVTNNPYAATSISPTETLWPSEHEGVVVIADTKMSKSTWKLTFERHRVSIASHDEVVCKSSDKAAFIKEFSFAPVGIRCLALKIDGKKKIIKLSEENVLDIIRLLGVDEWRHAYGKIGAKSMVIWGVVLLLLSGLMLSGTDTRTTSLFTVKILWILAGTIMIANGLLAKNRPRALNFALQMGSSGLIVVCIVIGMLTNFSYFQLGFLFLILIGIAITLQNYRLFKKFETTVRAL